MAPKVKQAFGVRMPVSMGLDMETATNVLITTSALYPPKFAPDTESSVPCDAIIEAPELAKHIYGDDSKETRVRRFDCENDLVLVAAIEPKEFRAKRAAAAAAAAANPTPALATAAAADSKLDTKAPPAATATTTPATATATGTAAPAADAKSAPILAAAAKAEAKAEAKTDAKADATTAAAAVVPAAGATGGGATAGDKKKKKKKKKPASATATAAADAPSGGATATTAAAPKLAAAAKPAAGADAKASASALVSNVWGSMCVNTYRFEGNSAKWMEIPGPVLMFAHPRVAKQRANSHYRVVDAKKLLSTTFDDEQVAKQQARFSATTWEGKNAAQQARHDMRHRGGQTEVQKLISAMTNKASGGEVSMAVPATAPAAPAAAAATATAPKTDK